MIQSMRPGAILRAQDLSHRVGHARNGQQPANLRVVARGVQVAQQDRRLAQGEVKGNDRAKLAAPFLGVAAGDVGQQGADGSAAVFQFDQDGVAMTPAAVIGQRDALPRLDRQPAEQSVAGVQAMPCARVRCKEPRRGEPLAQLARLIERLPRPRAVDFLQGDEIEVFQALGDSGRVAAAVEAFAAVDVERADAEASRGGRLGTIALEGDPGRRTDRRRQRDMPAAAIKAAKRIANSVVRVSDPPLLWERVGGEGRSPGCSETAEYSDEFPAPTLSRRERGT